MDYPQTLLRHQGGQEMKIYASENNESLLSNCREQLNLSKYDDVWRLQDEITAAVNALGYTVWELSYNQQSGTFRLELNEHVEDDQTSTICYQMPLTADYEGEGSHGSLYTLYNM